MPTPDVLERFEVLPKVKPDGQQEHETRTAIRDLIRLYGFEAAREMIAFYLIDEAERRH